MGEEEQDGGEGGAVGVVVVVAYCLRLLSTYIEKVVLWEDEEDQDKMEENEKQTDGGNCWQGMSCPSSSSSRRSRKSFISSIMISEDNGNEDALMKKNPIKMSVLQGYVKCSRLLHRFGWRIPQVWIHI